MLKQTLAVLQNAPLKNKTKARVFFSIKTEGLEKTYVRFFFNLQH